MNKNTLYITFDGLSDPLGQSQILPYLTGIAKNGFHITIISCEKQLRLTQEKENIELLLSKNNIAWKYIIYNEEGSSLSRYKYIQHVKAIAKSIVKQNKITLIHCRSYLAALIGLDFKRKYKIPFLFDMRGFWADERIDGEIWQKNNIIHNFFYKYFKRKEKSFIHEADAIVSLTNKGQHYLAKAFGYNLVMPKTTVIPCCTNTNLFSKANVNSNFKTVEIKGEDEIVIYSGSIGTWYYTKEMIDCIIEWNKLNNKIKLLLLTKDVEAASEILSTYPPFVKSIVIIKSASYSEVPNYLSLARAAIFFIKPSFSKIASSPTKMAECWSMNLAIITNAGIGDNDDFIKNENGGVLFNHFNSEEYQLAYSNYIKLKGQNINYRNIALKHFDNAIAINCYTELYNKLTHS